MTLILQITDGLSSTVIVDLNGRTTDGTGAYAASAPVLGRGQLDDSAEVAWSPAAGPAGLGRRQVEIAFVLVGSDPDDLAVRVAELMEATRGPWWLRVRRHQASQDSWLQCYACVPQIDSRITRSSAAPVATGTIVCETEPYALGARVDVAPTPVGQDPTVAGAHVLDVTGVQGDTATPLLVRMQDSTAFSVPMTTWVSVRRRGTPSNLTAAALTVQAEAATFGGSTGVTVAALTDSALSGGAGLRITFAAGYASPNPAQINWPAPSLNGPDVPGVYRVFARVRRSANTGTITLKAFTSPEVLTPDDINSAHPLTSATTQMVDLGLVQWPVGMPAAFESPVRSGAQATGIVMQVWKANSGAATVDLDYLQWVPADEDGGWLQTRGAIPSAASRWVVLDGAQDMVAITDADPVGGTAQIVGQPPGLSVANEPKPTWLGGIPRVGPGTSRLFIVTGVSTGSTLAKGNTLNVGYSYWPRYTWLR